MQLKTERLLLREFTSGDWPSVLAYQRDPRYRRFTAWTERTEADLQAFIQRFVDWQREEPRCKVQLAITIAASGELIGNVGLRRPAAGAQVAEMGFELSSMHWGLGYATEAASALLRFGFEELALHRISAHCIAENTASARVLEKLGMSLEGRLRESEYLKERWWDVLLYGILAAEWQG